MPSSRTSVAFVSLCVLSCVVFFSRGEAHAQLDTRHWIPPLWSVNGNDANVIGDHWVYISTPEVEPVAFTIKDGAGNSHSGVVSNSAPVGLHIGRLSGGVFVGNSTGGWAGTHTPHLVTGTAKLNSKLTDGLIIESERPVYASVRQKSGSQGEISASPGRKGLGTEFRALFAYNVKSTSTWRGSFISIMATEPGTTTVTVDDFKAGLKLHGLADNDNDGTSDPHTITLNQYESYIVGLQDSGYTGTAPLAAFNGTRVSSDKLIAVTSGFFLGGPTDNSGQDAGFDQLVPTELAGTEFVMIKGNAANTSLLETVTVVATEDNTDLFVKGETTPYNTTPLAAGGYAFIQGQYVGDGLYLRATKPVLVVQGIGGSDSLATSGANVIPPIGVDVSNFVDNIPVVNFYGTATIGIVTRLGATVTLNGEAPTVAPQPITGAPDWVTYKITGMTGTVSVVSNAAVAVSLINVSGVAGLAGYFSGFPSSPTLDLDGDDTVDGGDNCPDDPNLDQLDDDGDGIGNLCDQCDEDPRKALPGVCGCGTPDGDFDLDGVVCQDNCPYDANPSQQDADQDGIGDACADDLDNDGVLNAQDGCPLDKKKSAPGFCGCGFLETDSDLDGSPNCVDTCPLDHTKVAPGVCGCGEVDTVDSDGDTIPDCVDVCGNGAVDAGEDCDDGNASNTDACTVQCFARPAGVDDTAEVDEDGVVAIDVQANDGVGREVTTLLVIEPQHGVAVVQADGRVLYLPDPNYSGVDGFVYRLADDVSESDLVEVTLTVRAVNDAPTVSSIAAVSMLEEESKTTSFVVGDVETSAGSLLVTVTSSNPSVSATAGGSGASRSVQLVPAPNVSGVSTITVVVSDGELTSTRTFEVVVTAVNDHPVAVGEQVVVDEGGQASEVVGGGSLIGNDVDLEASPLSVELVSGPAHGSLVLGVDGTFLYTHDGSETSSDAFEYRVGDGELFSNTVAVVIAINPINDAPTLLGPEDVEFAEDAASGPLSFEVHDIDSASLTVSTSSSNPALLPDGSVVLGGSGTSRVLSINPPPNAHGVATLTLSVSDGVLTATHSFEVLVTPVNDAPTLAEVVDQQVSEDGALEVALVLDDIDDEPSSLSVQVTAGQPGLLASFAVTGQGRTRVLRVLPADNRHGATTLTVAVSDGEAGAERVFGLQIDPVNDAPVGTADSLLVMEGGTSTQLASGAASVLANDSDIDGDTLVATLVTAPTHGTLSLRSDGTFTYVHDGSETTADGFVYRLDDGAITREVAVSIAVTPVNNAPVAVVDELEVAEGGRVESTPLGNDTDAEGQALSAIVVEAPRHGVLEPIPGGGFAYTHDGSETVADSFSYAAFDGLAQSEPVVVAIRVVPVNDPPTLSTLVEVQVNEDGASAPLTVALADTDTETLTLTAFSADEGLIPASGLVLEGEGNARTLTIRPSANASGNTVVRLVVSDGQHEAETVVAVAVVAIDDAPVVASVPDQALAEDGSVEVPLEVSDVDSAVFEITAESDRPDLVAVSVFGASLRLVVAPDRHGAATITVSVHDGVNTTSRSFVVTVEGANDAPVGGPDHIALAEGGSVSVLGQGAATVLANDQDIDGDTLLASVVSAPSHGRLTLQPDGTFEYVHDGSETTSDGFTYRVSDGVVGVEVPVTISITPVNDAPIIAVPDDVVGLLEDTDSAPLAFSVSDAESDADSLEVTAQSDRDDLVAELVLSGSGATRTMIVRPMANQSGEAVVTLEVSDGQRSTQASFFVMIMAENDRPTVTAIADQVIEEDGATKGLALEIGDTETAATDLEVSVVSSNLDLVDDACIRVVGGGASRTLTVTPRPNASGQSTLTVTVSDGLAAAEVSFVLTVEAHNDAPTLAAPASVRVAEDTTSPLTGLAVADVDAGLHPLSVSVAVDRGTVSLEPAPGVTSVQGFSGSRLMFSGPVGALSETLATMTYAGPAHGSGADRIVITVDDGGHGGAGGALTARAEVGVVIDEVNDAPTIAAIEDLELADPEVAKVSILLADRDDLPSLLQLTVASSDFEVVPLDLIEIQGMGHHRELVVTSGGVPGESTVTVTAKDPGGLTSSVSFVVTVTCDDVDQDLRCDEEVTDTDGDGLSDERERELGTDPDEADTDGDGLSDGEEVAERTDPSVADTDGDGIPDGEEVEAGLDPRVAFDDIGLTGGGGCSGGGTGPVFGFFLGLALLAARRRRR